MDVYFGRKYVLWSNENFDEYLKNLGYSLLYRKAATAFKPTHTLMKNEDGSYTFTMSSMLMSTSISFYNDHEFIEERPPDGVQVKTKISLEGNRMIHKQTEDNGRTATHIREFYDDKMVVLTTLDGWDKVCVRTHMAITE